MINILCPIDFSDHSLYALDYAINLGNQLGARLHLFTAYSVPKSTGRLRSLDEEIKKSVLEDLSDVLISIENKITSGQKPLYSVTEGNSGRAILEFSMNHDIDIIVMGTQGKGSISNIFLGSVAKKVVDSSKIPVFAIPFPIKEKLDHTKVLLSLDEKEIKNESATDFVKNFTKSLQLSMEIFHVVTPEDKGVYKETAKLYKDVTDKLSIVESEDIPGSIKNYAEASNCGLIIMTKRPHSFWSRLFVDTNTTAELATTKIPILILPE
ncbi:MAG: universal stress protein [Saprospiraceae bacterium]|nr:universal stress protein [Saprospiraceae bacterium]